MRFIPFLFIILLYACQGTGGSGGGLTAAEEQKYYDFVSFLVQEKLTEEDKRLLREELQAGLQTAPEQTRQSLKGMFALADSVNKYQDPFAKGVWRSYILALYYPALQAQSQQTGKKYALQTLIEKYSPIWAIDKKAMRVYTAKDHAGLMELLRFAIQDLAHKKYNLTPKIEQEFKQKVSEGFPKMDMQAKNEFSALAVYVPGLEKQYSSLSGAEKEQFKQNLLKTLNISPNGSGFSGGGMSPAEFQIMNNIMNLQHQTSMSIINNMNPNWEYRYE